jgi:hypothetical protein
MLPDGGCAHPTSVDDLATPRNGQRALIRGLWSVSRSIPMSLARRVRSPREGPRFATTFRPAPHLSAASSMNARDVDGQPPVEPVLLQPWVPHAEDAVR